LEFGNFSPSKNTCPRILIFVFTAYVVALIGRG
jgi:hypothetical protein